MTTLTDTQAVDQIAEILSADEWKVDFLEYIGEIVRAAGRNDTCSHELNPEYGCTGGHEALARIAAKQVAAEADPVTTIARDVLHAGLESVDWDSYPEIGKGDWNAVAARALELAAKPDGDTFTAAYELLAERAERGPGED